MQRISISNPARGGSVTSRSQSKTRRSLTRSHDSTRSDAESAPTSASSTSSSSASSRPRPRPPPRLLHPAVASVVSLALAFSTLEASTVPPPARAESLLSFDFLKKKDAAENKPTAATAATAATKKSPLSSSPAAPPSTTKKAPPPAPLGRPPAVSAQTPSKKDAEALLKREREKEQREKEAEAQRVRQKAAAEKAEREAKSRARQAKQQQQQALIGGGAAALAALFAAKWQVVATAAAVLFRNIGGPSLISAIIRSPGTVFGRVVRVLQWNPAASAAPINSASAEFGPLRSLRLRAQTPEGLASAISRVEGAERRARRSERGGRGVSLSGTWSSGGATTTGDDGDDKGANDDGGASDGGASDGGDAVAAMAHWIVTPSPGFLQPITCAQDIALLPDPAFVVWVSKRDVLAFERAAAGEGGGGERFSFPLRGGRISSSSSSSSTGSSSAAASAPAPDGAPVSTAREALAELAAALEGEDDEAAVLAAASLEPAPFVALHRALFSASLAAQADERSEAEVEALRRRQRLVKAAREVASRQSDAKRTNL